MSLLNNLITRTICNIQKITLTSYYQKTLRVLKLNLIQHISVLYNHSLTLLKSKDFILKAVASIEKYFLASSAPLHPILCDSVSLIE